MLDIEYDKKNDCYIFSIVDDRKCVCAYNFEEAKNNFLRMVEEEIYMVLEDKLAMRCSND